MAGDVLEDFFDAIGTPQPAQAPDTNGHSGHFGHFIALPNTGENKSSEIYKNRENKKEVRTASGTEMRLMRQMRLGKLNKSTTDLPTIRASASVALALETYGPHKGDGLAGVSAVSGWPSP